MILRSLTMAASLAGGLAASQFPAFSQQYAQRLGGAVDELSQVVADFDASARAAGLTREEALRDLAGSTFRDRRQQDMRRTFRRHARLSAVRAELAEASALDRLTLVPKAADRDIADAAWAEFRPAVPLTWDGLLFAAAGFFGLLAMLRLTGAAIGMSRGAARRTRGRRVQ
ncbi:MAG: DUF2937 family protein [Pseudomonadota bacterium]